MAKVSADDLLDAIGEMTVLELSEFVKSFEEKFGVTAAPQMMAAAPGAGGGGGAEPLPRPRSRTSSTWS